VEVALRHCGIARSLGSRREYEGDVPKKSSSIGPRDGG
jgi:hypothetical protein